jgi:hypothetical protein
MPLWDFLCGFKQYLPAREQRRPDTGRMAMPSKNVEESGGDYLLLYSFDGNLDAVSRYFDREQHLLRRLGGRCL